MRQNELTTPLTPEHFNPGHCCDLVPIVREIDYPSQGCKLPVYRSGSNIAVATLDIASD